MDFRNHFISLPTKFGGHAASSCICTQVSVVGCGSYLHPNCMNAGSIRQIVHWSVNEDAVEACLVLVVAWIIVGLIRFPVSNTQIYRVSTKSFPDYKHLLQENYVEYNFSFTIKLVSKILCQSVYCNIWFYGCNISKQVDWEWWSDTLATTIAGYHHP